jgi:hypothetical protein
MPWGRSHIEVMGGEPAVVARFPDGPAARIIAHEASGCPGGRRSFSIPSFSALKFNHYSPREKSRLTNCRASGIHLPMRRDYDELRA